MSGMENVYDLFSHFAHMQLRKSAEVVIVEQPENSDFVDFTYLFMYYFIPSLKLDD